ncbi:MAG: hypothetical protein GOV00_04215 [Candidatus Altiarchaeota archaeon]|nr:hypothetical protein [Candidatus Altiarchaeota archaeon]
MFKKYKAWMEPKIRKMSICDIKLIKLSVAAFTLMLAKFWPVLLGLEWYWYALIGTAAALKPLKLVLAK